MKNLEIHKTATTFKVKNDLVINRGKKVYGYFPHTPFRKSVINSGGIGYGNYNHNEFNAL